MDYEVTYVHDIDTTNTLLDRGRQLLRVRPNKAIKGRLVFVFKGNLKAEVNEILIQLGKKQSSKY